MVSRFDVKRFSFQYPRVNKKIKMNGRKEWLELSHFISGKSDFTKFPFYRSACHHKSFQKIFPFTFMSGRLNIEVEIHKIFNK